MEIKKYYRHQTFTHYDNNQRYKAASRILNISEYFSHCVRIFTHFFSTHTFDVCAHCVLCVCATSEYGPFLILLYILQLNVSTRECLKCTPVMR